MSLDGPLPNSMIRIRCGCCQDPFNVKLGGSAYCPRCLDWKHEVCIAKELGLKNEGS